MRRGYKDVLTNISHNLSNTLSFLLLDMRAIAEYARLATPTATYKGTTLDKYRSIRQYYSHMSPYTQGTTFYHFNFHLWHYMNYILIHNLVFCIQYKNRPDIYFVYYSHALVAVLAVYKKCNTFASYSHTI